MTTESTAPTTLTPAHPPRETPKFTGVTIHRDPRGRFSVRYPTNWHLFEIRSNEPLVDGERAAPPQPAATPQAGKKKRRREAKADGGPVAAREGIGFLPDSRDPVSVFTVWASPLGQRIVAEDLPDLKAGVDEALQALEDCRVEAASDTVLGNLIRCERIYTFREGAGEQGAGAVRKRKQWLLYVDTWLICLTWQGSSVAEYEYWFAMANHSFLTFELPQALWFYTDRELLGQLSATSAAAPGNPYTATELST